MKNKNKTVVIAIIYLSLTFCGCATESPVTSAEIPSSSSSIVVTTDTAAPATQIGNPDVTTEKKDFICSGQGISMETAAETPDAQPSTEEIMDLVEAKENRLFWCTKIPAYSGIIKIPSIEIPDTAEFSAQLSELLGEAYRFTRTDGSLIELTPNEVEPDIEALLSVLPRITGTPYVEITPEEIYVAQYVPELNGYPVDEEGFFYSGDQDGDYVPGSYVGVSESGEITIFHPFIVKASARSINATELVTPETVEMVCRAYYESLPGPFVTVITNIKLEYYYSESEESLLPAWRCEMTFYATKNGHNDSILLDAQTGELLRK